MKVSYNRLKELTPLPWSAERLADILTMLGVEAEHVEHQRARYEHFFIGEVLTKEKHPDAKKLSVCTVTTGGVARQIICGAPNVEAGQRVVVALPGAVVPSNGLVIGERAIRGVESSGMICSKAELGVSGEHDGIWVLPDDAQTGMPLADFLGENDVIIEIAITANRADCLGLIGVARDAAAFAGLNLNVPQPAVTEDPARQIVECLSVEIRDAEKCPRYAARVVRGVTIGESPAWLKQHLTALGLRPRNIAVDVTNYVMMHCGQPLHAFDYEQLAGGKIVVRTARDGELFTTLDGRERTLDGSMLMICDADKSVAIAGVMGGENSEITEKTSIIVIESAYFQPSSIRRTAKKLGLSTDASYRFERGVDYGDNIVFAANLAATMIAEYGGGTIDAGIVDIYPNPISPNAITLRYKRAEDIIGVAVSPAKMRDFLHRLGCGIIAESAAEITVSAPTWRVDMEQEIDLIEEVARLTYYDDIAPAAQYTVPNVTETAAAFTAPTMRRRVREFLARRGFNQLYNYHFTDAESAGLFGDGIALSNPLGEEFAVLRTSLLPSALRVISRNVRAGAGVLRLFETGKHFHTTEAGESTFIRGIAEREAIMIAVSGAAEEPHWGGKQRQTDFYDAKGAAEELLDFLGFSAQFRPAESPETGFTINSATIEINAGGRAISVGTVGEITADLRETYDVPQPVFCVILDAGALYGIQTAAARYEKISPFPGAERDAAFILDAAVSAQEAFDIAAQSAGEFFRSAAVFDVFSGGSLGEGKKSLGLRLSFGSQEKTLAEADISTAVQNIVDAIGRELHGTLRG